MDREKESEANGLPKYGILIQYARFSKVRNGDSWIHCPCCGEPFDLGDLDWTTEANLLCKHCNVWITIALDGGPIKYKQKGKE